MDCEIFSRLTFVVYGIFQMDIGYFRYLFQLYPTEAGSLRDCKWHAIVIRSKDTEVPLDLTEVPLDLTGVHLY